MGGLLEKTQGLPQVTRVAEQKYTTQDDRKELLVKAKRVVSRISHFTF